MHIRGGKHAAAWAIALAAFTAAAGGPVTSAAASPVAGKISGTLNGSGSTFQQTFQQQAISGFRSVQPDMRVNYGGGGSGKGRTDLASGVVNFAGSDSPIPASEIANFKGKQILYFPVVIGPITLSYNLSGVKSLRLSPQTIAGIFDGKITNWNDPAIKADNPKVNLPNERITTAVRSDSSGTTENFTLFLQRAAGSAWPLGSSSTISWPSTARAGNGNGGVAQIVKSTPGAIGYVDFADARGAGLHFASVKNAAGKFITPTPAGSSKAAAATPVSSNLVFESAWAKGAKSYPVTAQSWVLVDKKQPNAAAVKRLRAYLSYLLGPAQKTSGQLGYAPLPKKIDQQAKKQLSQITS